MSTTVIKITQVIVEIFPDRYLVKCGTCNGKGRYNGTCHVCKSVGQVFLQIPQDWQGKDIGLLRCGTCDGNGRYDGTCHVCKGIGVIIACFPRIICGTCGGNGRYNGTCHVCKGKGAVFIESIKSY